MTADSAALVVASLTAGYGRLTVVRDVSLHVRRGEIVALVGRNGAAKTTALAAISGLRYGPSAGSVRLGGEDVTTLAAHELARRGLQFIPAGRRVFPSMTVAENLRLGAYRHRRAPRDQIAADLGRVYEFFPALAGFAKVRAGELSGGQQQMLAIGLALMSHALYLLLDEPSAGLAPSVAHELYDRFEDLAASGVGLLVVEQNVELALERSGRYYLMEGGRVLAEGRSEAAALDVINAVILGDTTTVGR